MDDVLGFELILPDGVLLTGNVTEVIIAGEEGDFTLLPGHSPLLSSMRPGILSVTFVNGDERRVFVRGGVVDAGPDKIVVLAEGAIPVEKFDLAAFEQELGRFEDHLSVITDDADRDRASERLEHLKQLRAVVA